MNSPFYRYYLTSKEDTQKVINLILSYQPCLLSDWDINRILDQYPNKAA